MGRAETEMGGARGSFQSTLWSLVLRAKDPTSADRREALETLIRAYWKPLYLFVRRKGSLVEASKDLTQGFFSELLAKDFLKHVDRDRGKFRTFLLSAFEHYVADEYDKARALKRGGGAVPLSLDFEGAERDVAGSVGSAEQGFKRDWAIRVMAQAMEAVKASFTESKRTAEFEAFRAHLTSTRPEGASYEEMARTLGVSVGDVRNRVRAARARYREAILDIIRSYSDTDGDAQDELRDLLSAFS